MEQVFKKFILLSSKVLRKLRLIPDLILVSTSSIFNRAWYLKNNPDIAQAKVNPEFHYLCHGGFEGRDPGPGFSSSWYLERYGEVKMSGINPLVHYIKYGQGKKERRAIHSGNEIIIPIQHIKTKRSSSSTKLPKRLTFFFAESHVFQVLEPLAQIANERGYEVVFTNDLSKPADVGFFADHYPNPGNARFSLVMFHDLLQNVLPECPSLEPNSWTLEPWNNFDIGVLPGPALSQCWASVSSQDTARPRLGVFELGWPKGDCVFNNSATFREKVSQLRKSLQLKDQPSVLYAPSWENDGKRDDFIQSLIHLPVNLLIKQAALPPSFEKKWFPNRKNLKEETSV